MATLEVSIFRAQRLKAMDLNGKSDPYVKLCLGKTKHKTKVVQKSLEPQWNETFSFPVTDAQRELLKLEVFDKDMIGRDDPLGTAMISLAALVEGETDERWINLQNVSTGSIFVAVTARNFGLRKASKSGCISTPHLGSGFRLLEVRAHSASGPALTVSEYNNVGLLEAKAIPVCQDDALSRALNMWVAAPHPDGVSVRETFKRGSDILSEVVSTTAPLAAGVANEHVPPPFQIAADEFSPGDLEWNLVVFDPAGGILAERRMFLEVYKRISEGELGSFLARVNTLWPFDRPIVLGPVLHFRGIAGNVVRTSFSAADPDGDGDADINEERVLRACMGKSGRVPWTKPVDLGLYTQVDHHGPLYYSVAALVVTKHLPGHEVEPEIRVESHKASVTKHVLAEFREGERDLFVHAKLWCFEWGVELSGEGQRVEYEVAMDGITRHHAYHVPARGAPPAFAATSCNGFHDELNRVALGPQVEGVWRQILEQHMAAAADPKPGHSPYHLILQGGDQIYADGMIDRIPELKGWEPRFKLSLEETEDLSKRFFSVYFRMYCEHWALPIQTECFASIPSIMIWDDHDIFDGWGSYQPDVQDSPAYQYIFTFARSAFSLFQLGMLPDARQPSTVTGQDVYSAAYGVGPVGFYSMDVRTERSLVQVMSEKSRGAMYSYLDAMAERNAAIRSGAAPPSAVAMQHLVVISPICMMYGDFTALEALMETHATVIGGERLELEDDLKDHWRSPNHHAERVEIIEKLLAFAYASKCRVTLVSGDVHLAAVAVLQDMRPEAQAEHGNACSIVQVVSSPVMNMPTSGSSLTLTERLSAGREALTPTLTGKVLRLPGKSTKVISARNFVEFKPHKTGADGSLSLVTTYFLEDDPDRPSFDVMPVSASAAPEFPLNK